MTQTIPIEASTMCMKNGWILAIHGVQSKFCDQAKALTDTCPQAANHFAYFEFETVLKFYNFEA